MKNFKSHLIAGLFCTFFFNLTLIAQFEVELSFEHYEEEYTPLEEFRNLTEEAGVEVWDFYYGLFEADPPIVIPGFNPHHPLENLEIIGFSGIYFDYLDIPEEYLLELILFEMGFMSPLNDTSNSDQGAILYHFEDGISTVEYRNVAVQIEETLGDGQLRSRINMQMEVSHSDARSRIIFGPSVISSSLKEYFSDNLLMASLSLQRFVESSMNGGEWLSLRGVANGDPSDPEFLVHSSVDPDPTFTGLDSFPEAGRVYEFQISSTTSMAEVPPPVINWRIFPNPGGQTLNLQIMDPAGENFNGKIFIYSGAGPLVRSLNIADQKIVDTSNMPSGIYYIQLVTPEGVDVKKWVKHF